MPDESDDMIMYSMLRKVVTKRTTYPSLLMRIERDRIDAELQALAEMKVDVDNTVTKQEVESLKQDLSSHLAHPPNKTDFSILNQLQQRKDMMAEMANYMRRANVGGDTSSISR